MVIVGEASQTTAEHNLVNMQTTRLVIEAGFSALTTSRGDHHAAVSNMVHSVLRLIIIPKIII